MDIGWLNNIGRCLFRYRSYTPLILGGLLFTPFVSAPTVGGCVGAMIFSVCGEMLRLWAVRHATGATRTREDQPHELCLSGPYAIIRNPLYVGNILLYSSGAWLLSQSLWIVPLVALLFCVQYGLIQIYEAHVCTQKFGQKYIEYCRRVPAWIPHGLSRWDWVHLKQPAPDTWKTAWSNERRSITALLIVWGIFSIKVAATFFLWPEP